MSDVSGARTHLQKLVEQTEGVDIVETVVPVPVSEFAVIAELGSVSELKLVFEVAVGALPPELLRPSSLQPSGEPAEANARHRAGG